MSTHAAVVPHPTLGRAKEDSSAEIQFDYSGLPPRVPDAKYKAVFIRHEAHWVFKVPKVFLWFRIVDPGEHFGTELYRAYRTKSINREGKHAGFKVKRGSDLFDMLVRVLDVTRPDRVSTDGLKSTLLEIETRTVTKDHKQRELPDWLRYSVIKDVRRESLQQADSY